MELDDPHHGGSSDEAATPDATMVQMPRILPDDLPKSLDDRRSMPMFKAETEMFDGWQGAYLFSLSCPVIRCVVIFGRYDRELSMSCLSLCGSNPECYFC